MQKRRRLALLSLLLLVSVGSAVVVDASGVLQRLASNVEEVEINVQALQLSSMLSQEERERAINIVLMDSQVQEMLEGVDNYNVQVSEVFDIHEIEAGIVLIPKEGLALVTLQINKDYGEDFGVQVVKLTVDLLNDEIKETEENPEIRKPKVHEGTTSPSELVQNPSEYDGVIVTVSGKVSLLGEVFGYLFMLDETVTVFYRHEQASVDVSNIENGDYVTVTGKFSSPETIYALEIEKM
jgi:acetolactate synthase small subunit